MTIQRKKRTAGFTLIELLVVVLIIGILSAIAIPQYFKVVAKGRVAEAQQFINQLTNAQEAYLTKFGSYYAGDLTASRFDIALPGSANDLLNYYSIGPIAAGAGANPPTWSVALTRWDTAGGAAATEAYYGSYKVEFTGGQGGSWSDNAAAGSADLVP